MMNPDRKIIKIENLRKTFEIGKETFTAIDQISFEVKKGDFAIIYGPSGSGKSTILNCMIGLEKPTSGQVWVDEERIDNMNDDERGFIRAQKIGVVYQQSIWIKSLNIIENVALPLMINGWDQNESYKRAKKTLEEVGMHQYADHKPTEISGGQQQRVSLARALIQKPKILILDEPTGNLDTHASDHMMQLLAELNYKKCVTVIMVTHNLAYLPLATRTVEIIDGGVRKIYIGHGYDVKEPNEV